MSEKAEPRPSQAEEGMAKGPVGDVVANPGIKELARRVREGEEPRPKHDFSAAAIIERGVTGKSWKITTVDKEPPKKAA